MIRLDQTGDLWTVTLDRPDKANALTVDMLTELTRICRSAQDAKALVLTGTGRVFSAGADLQDVDRLAVTPLWDDLSQAIADLRGLTIAALNGTLAGGSFGMALACDLRVAVPGAKFFYPVMKLGILPQPADPVRLRALVGPSRARLILMAGQKLSAEQALSFGLIDQITGDLPQAVQDLTADVLTASAAHIAKIKDMTR